MKIKLFLLLFLIALTVRVLMMAALINKIPVDGGLLATAESLLSGHGFADPVKTESGKIRYEPTAFEMPGHAVVIAALWWLIGSKSLIAIQLLQIIIDSLFVCLVYLIGQRLFSERIGFLSALLFAIYLPQAYLSIFIKRDVWVSWGVILACLLIVQFIRKDELYFVAMAGFIIALATYFSPSVMFLPLFLGIALLFTVDSRKVIGSVIMMMSIVFIGLLPWIARNYYHFNKFIPTRTAFYQTMWEGFGEFQNPFGAVLNDEITFKHMRQGGFQGRPTTPEYDEFIKPKVLSAIKEQPWWYVKTVIKRIPRALIVNRTPWGVFQDPDLAYHKIYAEMDRQKSILNYAKFMLANNPGFLLTKVFDVIILFLAILGIYLSRDNWKWSLLLLGVLLYFIAVYIPMHIEGKYMVPSHWVYLIFMSVTLIHFKDRLCSYFSQKARLLHAE